MDRPALSLRPVTGEDMEFLFRVYSSTRQEELALVDWDPAQKEAFLRMQFSAQHQYYTANYPEASFEVILLDGQPIGRLYLDRRAAETRIVDIALLPAYRGRGLGSILLEEILAESGQRGLPVSIHVECFNPAQRLYRRLGFRPTGGDGVYLLLEWLPEVKEHA